VVAFAGASAGAGRGAVTVLGQVMATSADTVAVSAAPVVLAPAVGTGSAGELRIELRNLGLGPARRVDLDIYDESGTLARPSTGPARERAPGASRVSSPRAGPR
jgi:hypothetical protein